MDEQTSDARYTMGRSKEEEERLIHQSQLYDAITRRFLNEAGVGRGWCRRGNAWVAPTLLLSARNSIHAL